MLLFITVLVFGLSSAHAQARWLNPWGAGDLLWGTDEQPMDVVARPRDYYLPDAGYVGGSSRDRPDDLELTSGVPTGERHFLRYVHGALVDAWLVRQGPIDTADFERLGTEEWSGVVLGPSTDGFYAFGQATSWAASGRTVMIWRDRSSTLEILASRSLPSGRYGVERAAPLAPDRAGRRGARISGDLKQALKPWSRYISGCLDQSPKPIEGRIEIAYDNRGLPARIRVDADQATMDLRRCWAGAVVQSHGPGGRVLEARVFRMR